MNRISFLLCLSFLFSLPQPLSHACGPGDYSFKGYSFLDPNIAIYDSTFAPYFFQFDELYDGYKSGKIAQITGNLEEWQDIFCDRAKLPDLQQVIYKSSVEQLEALRTSIYSKNRPLEFRFAKNSFARHLKSNRCTETIDYLIFAKKCEPHVIATDPWEAPPRDTLRMQQLIDAGTRTFLKTKSNYIKLRYAYQLIRLAHYAKNYRQVLSLYDQLLPKTDPMESILNDWILGHRAGGLAGLGQEVDAAYDYLRIFQNCPSKRESAYQSFRIRTDEQWHQVFLLCKDDQERATLYALRAQSDDSRIIEEMKQIYELDPANLHLESLLVRELKRLEKDMLGLEFNDQRKANKRYHKIPRKQAPHNLVKLDSLVRKVIVEEKIPHLDLWKLANGYLEFLAGDLYAAEKTFANLKKELDNEALIEQLDAFELALQVVAYEDMDSENEKEIFEIITQNEVYKKYPSFPDFVNDRVGAIYAKENHPGKAFRFHHTLKELKPNPQITIIEDLLKVCGKEDQSLLEEILILDQDHNLICDPLLDIKGSLFFQDGRLEPALEVYKDIPLPYRDTFQFNPFIDRLNECVFCPLPDSIAYFNKAEIIERLFELEYKAKADFENSALYNYELGTAYFNMSYFGHSWEVMDYYRSGSNWYYDKDNIYPLWFSPYDNKEHNDLSKALMYFQKTIDDAKDMEMAARAAFMAARCEHNSWYLSKECDYNRYGNQVPEIPPSYNKYFNLLRDNYSGTQFFEEAIRECLFFRAYAIR